MSSMSNNTSSLTKSFQITIGANEASFSRTKMSERLLNSVPISIKPVLSNVQSTLLDNPIEVSLVRKLQQLESGKFIFKNKVSVKNFLLKNPYLLGLLEEAYAKIRQLFTYERLYLEFYRDVEGAEYDQLLLKISTKLEVQEANKKLDHLEDTWWLSNMDRSDNKLSILLEYV